MKKLLLCIPLIIGSTGAFAALQCECEPVGVNGQGGEVINSGECCSDGIRCCKNGSLSNGGSVGGGTELCLDCESTSWAATGRAGYQSKVTATCSSGVCTKKTSYRCAAGYYGSSTNGTTGCTKCPSLDGVAGTSSAGSTTCSACCVASGTASADTKGSYKLSAKCCCS